MSPLRATLGRQALIAAGAALLLAGTAEAAPSGWASARAVKATHTECGGESHLVLKGPGAKAPPARPGCTSTEENYYELDVASALVGRAGVAETNLDAGVLMCGSEAGVMMLGRAREIDTAIRSLPAPPRGCRYTKRRYESVTSVGSIPLKGVVRQQMSVPESLVFHQKERDQAIAKCNASPACRAEVARRRAGSGNKTYTCEAGYSLNGSSDNPYATCVRNPP